MAKHLTEEEKREIRKLYLEGKSTKELAKQFGRARSTISKIIKAASIQIRNRREALELSETWQKRKETKRFGVRARTETPEQARRREVNKMSKRKLKAGMTKMSDLPLFEAGAKAREQEWARERDEEARAMGFKSYYHMRYKTEPEFRLKEIYRARFHKFVAAGSSVSMSRLIGCTRKHFRLWIESQWEDWMTWDNLGPPRDGYWQIDHVVPCSWFDHSNPDHLELCWNYQNLRPLCAVKNLIAKNRGVDCIAHLDGIRQTPIRDRLIKFAKGKQ